LVFVKGRHEQVCGTAASGKWNELAGWSADVYLAAFAAYQTSCQALRKMRRADKCGGSAPYIASAE